MEREEARELLLGYSRFINEETDLWEALDLAIEALKGDLYCPKCGTIVRDGRQYHDLVYRGEAEPIKGDAESATTTDCISRADTLKALCAECDANSHCYYPDKEAYCTEYAIVKGMPPVNQKQITGKLKNPCDSLLTEDSESVKEQKSKLESDTISRQAAIDAVEKAVFKGVAKSSIESLPPVEPPKKVIAQIKVDTEEIVERIKEEYEIKDRPVCEDAISRADTIKAMCRECTQEGRDECRADCTEVAVVKNMPPVEPATNGYVPAEHAEGGKK